VLVWTRPIGDGHTKRVIDLSRAARRRKSVRRFLAFLSPLAFPYHPDYELAHLPQP
jgi:hypothetical protein